MTGRTAPSDVLLAEVFLSSKAYGRRSVHNPRDHFIMTLIISERHDIQDKWPLVRSWWHRHTSLKLFWAQPMVPWTAGCQQSARSYKLVYAVNSNIRRLQVLQSKCLRIIAGAPWYVRNLQLDEDLEVSYLAKHRNLAQSFDSKVPDLEKLLVGRYLSFPRDE